VRLRRRRDASLRGCVGRVEPCDPLLAAVRRAAVAAASADPRFAPVTIDELPTLAVQVSVLGPLLSVRPDEVEVGVHGLWVSHRGRQAVLLPQVAARAGWEREVFLGRTCGKAGLPHDAWRDPLCRIRAFTALSFADGPELPVPPA
jgi:AmmeMemoRadiSam system protein A